MRTRIAGPALAGSVLVLALGACSGDAETSSAEPTPSASSSESPEPPSESPSAEPDGGAGPASEAFLERLKAGMGQEGSVHVEMEMTGPVRSTAEGDTTYSPDGSEMRLTVEMANMPGGAMEMVVVDDKAYMSMPGITGADKFFEVDKGNPAFSGLQDGLSPADSFAAFDAGLENVEEVGSEEIGGESTTRYKLDVDAEKAVEASGQGSVPGLPETLTYDVWLDSQDRMRRLVYELAGTKLTMDMTDWGKVVTIEAPDPKDVVDAPPIMGG